MRLMGALILGSAMVCLAGPGPALAAGGADAASGGHAAHTILGEPPQSYFGPGTEFLYVSPALLLWTLGLFLVLAFLLDRLAWKPILASLADRERRMRADFEEAQAIRADAQKILEYHDEVMGKAHEEIKHILEEARAQAAKESESILAEARHNAARSAREAGAAIAGAKELAMGQLREGAVRLSTEIAGRVAGKEISREAAQLLVQEGDG